MTPTTVKRYPPVLVPCAIDVGGTVLEGTCDLDLAWKWAAHDHGAAWESMGRTEKAGHVADALDALRKAVAEAGSV